MQAKLSQSRASKSQDTVAAASVTKEQPVDKVKAAFDQVTNEAEFLGTLKQVLNHPSAPDFLLPAFQDFYNNYKSESTALMNHSWTISSMDDEDMKLILIETTPIYDYLLITWWA